MVGMNYSFIYQHIQKSFFFLFEKRTPLRYVISFEKCFEISWLKVFKTHFDRVRVEARKYCRFGKSSLFTESLVQVLSKACNMKEKRLSLRMFREQRSSIHTVRNKIGYDPNSFTKGFHFIERYKNACFYSSNNWIYISIPVSVIKWPPLRGWWNSKINQVIFLYTRRPI